MSPLCTLAPLTAPAAGTVLPAKVVAMGAPAKIVAVSCLARATVLCEGVQS